MPFLLFKPKKASRPKSPESIELPVSSNSSLGEELTATTPRLPWNDIDIDSDSESQSGGTCSSSDSSTSSEDREDEDEVLFDLHEPSLAQLPSHLRKNLRDMHAERLNRLSLDNPHIQIRSNEDYGMAPSTPFQEPPCFRHIELEYPALVEDFPHVCNMGSNGAVTGIASATPAKNGNAFGRPASTAGEYLERATQTTPEPFGQNEERSGKARQSPKKKAGTHKNRDEDARSRSLALKRGASNLRTHVKRSLQKLNKLIRK